MILPTFVFVLYLGLCDSKSAKKNVKFPEQFQSCHRKDPNMDSCLAKAIESAIHSIGSKGLRPVGLPAIDPVEINEIHIGEGASAIHLIQNYYNVKISGCGHAKVPKAHFDDKKLELSFTVSGNVQQKARYNVTGKVFLIPVHGEGDSTINFYNATLDLKFKFKEEMRDNVKYYVVEECTLDLKCTDAHYYFENVFNANKQLAERILKVVNDNPLDIFNDVKPGVDKSYALVCKALAQFFFEKVPANAIFPE